MWNIYLKRRNRHSQISQTNFWNNLRKSNISRKNKLFIFKSTFIMCIRIYSKASTFYQLINYLEKNPTISAMTFQSIYRKIFTKVITLLLWNTPQETCASDAHYLIIKQRVFHLRELIYLLLIIINIIHIHCGEKKYLSFPRFRGACWLVVLFYLCIYSVLMSCLLPTIFKKSWVTSLPSINILNLLIVSLTLGLLAIVPA